MILVAAFLIAQTDGLKALAARDQVKIDELTQPLAWHGDGYWVRGKPPKAEALKTYEPLFEKEWSIYPASLITKARLKRIVFAADLSVDGQPRAAVPAFDGDTMYYDPDLGANSPHYQRVVIHHEFFHMIDDRMGHLRDDPEWAKLNPGGFRYGAGGDKMRTSGVGELTDRIPGFVTPYGTAAVEEDKAELFAHAIVDSDWVSKQARRDPVLGHKLALLKERLASFEPVLGESWWKRASEPGKAFVGRIERWALINITNPPANSQKNFAPLPACSLRLPKKPRQSAGTSNGYLWRRTEKRGRS